MYEAIKITILLKRGQTLSNKLKGWANTNPRDVGGGEVGGGWGGGGGGVGQPHFKDREGNCKGEGTNRFQREKQPLTPPPPP